MNAGGIRLLAAAMTVAHGLVWFLASRWERPGRRPQLQTSWPGSPLALRVGDVAQVLPLLYPLLVMVAPGWGYEGWLNWSSRIDPALQAVGLALWGVGMALLVWAARVLGRYMSVEGVTVDHELVTSGPYRHVRHPVYTSLTAVAVGVTLVFRSWLLVAVSLVWVAIATSWAAAEEEMLSSSEPLGDAYRRYVGRTGRFLPRRRPA